MIEIGNCANAAISYDSNVLKNIHLPSKNIAIYKRCIAPLKSDLELLKAKTIGCRVTGKKEEIQSELQDYFSSHLSQYRLLFEDVVALVELFEKITQAPSFRLLLTTVSTNMCRKFHTDINDLRLLCTYFGPGTLWIPDEAFDLKAIQAGGKDQKIVIDEKQIQQAEAGDVLILKGDLYTNSHPVMHRSPAIEQKKQKRLLLRIDTDSMLDI